MIKNDVTLTDKGLECLEQPLPPEFEEMLEHETSTNYLAIFWDDDDAELVYDDGFWENTLDMEVWDWWIKQLGVNARLEHLYCPAQRADYALLLDLDTRQLYMGNREVVRRIVGRRFSSEQCQNTRRHSNGRHLQADRRVGDRDTYRLRQPKPEL